MAYPTVKGKNKGTSIQDGRGTGFFVADGVVTAMGPNFIIEAGANNALVGTLTSIAPGIYLSTPISAGLRVLVKTQHTLQSGANTFNLNHSGAIAIKNMGSRNIKTTVASGAILDLVYDGTYWILLNSTY